MVINLDLFSVGKVIRAMKKFITSIAVVLVFGVGCNKRARRTDSDTLVVLVDAVHRDLDPRFALTSHDTKLSRLIAPGLTTVDTQDLNPKKLLAEEIDELNETLWQVKIKKGIRFSDGTPLTAEDVAYTYNSVMSDAIGSLHKKSFRKRYKEIVVVDELTLKFILHEPLATIMSDFAFGIVSKKVSELKNEVFDDGRVLGAGVYKIDSFSPENIELSENLHYWGARPKTPKIRLKTVRDSSARNLMMIGGSADLTQNSIRADLVDTIAAKDRIKAIDGRSAILTYMMMNNEDPLLADPRVRRAIAYGIDRKRIVKEKILGRALLATGFLPPGHWAYEDRLAHYNYDPEKAKKLLDEAGYTDPDGPGGKPRMSLSYKTSANQFRLAIARVIASQLLEIGIDVDVRTFEFGTFFADIKKGRYQLGAMDTAPITEPDYYYTYFHSERIPTKEHPHLHNRWRYKNKRIDELTLAGRKTASFEKRKEIYREVQVLLAEDLPVLPLWHLDNVALVNRTLEGYEVLPNASFAYLPFVEKHRE